VTTKETFLWSLDEIGSVVYEEMLFKAKVYGRTPDEKRSQKLTLSLCDSWAKNKYLFGIFFIEVWSHAKMQTSYGDLIS
jgi:hypothetical protein